MTDTSHSSQCQYGSGPDQYPPCMAGSTNSYRHGTGHTCMVSNRKISGLVREIPDKTSCADFIKEAAGSQILPQDFLFPSKRKKPDQHQERSFFLYINSIYTCCVGGGTTAGADGKEGVPVPVTMLA